MERTRDRPLPAEQVTPQQALAFGLALSVLATAILLATGGVLAAGIGVASILFYVFVYTVWLKPRSIWNAVVGGASGAVAPLIADAAVDGHIGAAGWLLFAIIFFWQPPHVWAIALYRRRDYEAAGIPCPAQRDRCRSATRWQMLRYTLALVTGHPRAGRPRSPAQHLSGGRDHSRRVVHLARRSGVARAHRRGRAARVPGFPASISSVSFSRCWSSSF